MEMCIDMHVRGFVLQAWVVGLETVTASQTQSGSWCQSVLPRLLALEHCTQRRAPPIDDQPCVDMCIDVCIDICMDMCVDMCMDMCVDMQRAASQ